MKNFWKILKGLKRYSQFLMPLIGFLLIAAKYLENFLKFLQQMKDSNSVPSGRDEDINDPDGNGFKQIESEVGSKKDSKPEGVKPITNTQLEGEGQVKPVSPTKPDEINTGDVIAETEKYQEQ